jgi:hypothetical protein
MVPTKEELRIAEMEDALDHICAVCKCPQMMSFTINLDYVARYARAALKDATPWTERVTRQSNNSTAKQG